jgi:oxaloacetate decarboxylase gamma subunit
MDNIKELLLEAASLMAIGMAMVFLFLTILVFVVRLMSKLVPTDEPLATTRPKNSKKIIRADSNDAVDPKVVAAISVAIHQHRSSVSA